MNRSLVSISPLAVWSPQAPGSYAQPQRRTQAEALFRVRHFTTADGLPQRSVFAILEDHLGFLRLVTGGELVRYDGYTFTTFRPRQGDSTSIGGNAITVLHEDAAGNLWAGGSPGILGV